MNKFVLTLYILFTLLSELATAQQVHSLKQQYSFKTYNTENGLPQEEVLCAFQDKDGYMWFGTYSGMARYNGRDMQVFTTEDGLHSNIVYDITQDYSGRIYFVTNSGINYMEEDSIMSLILEKSFAFSFIDSQKRKWFYGKNDVLITDSLLQFQKLPSEINLKNNRLLAVQEDRKNKNIYLGTENGLYELSQDLSPIYKFDIKCNDLLVDYDNKLWLSDGKLIYQYSASKQKIKNIHIPELANQNIHEIKLLSDSSLLFICDYTVVIFKEGKSKTFSNKNGLANHYIYNVFEDKEQNLWFCMSGAAQKLSNANITSLSPSEFNGYVFGIREDSLKRIWFNYNEKVYFCDGDIYEIEKLLGLKFRIIHYDFTPKGNILLASERGLLELDYKTLQIVRKNIFDYHSILNETAFVSSKKEIFVLGGMTGKIQYFKDFHQEPELIQTKYTSNLYKLIEFEDKILGANNTGIVEFENNKFVSFLDMREQVWTLYNHRGTLWVGTEKGLAYFEKGRLHYQGSEYFNSDVNAIHQSNDPQYIWVGTNKGLHYYNLYSKKSELFYNKTDGLNGNEISIHGLYLDSKERLWLGSFHGLNIIQEGFEHRDTMQTPLEVEVLVNNRSQGFDLMHLHHSQNNIRFELTALSFINESSTEYEFFLEGMNKEISYSKSSEYWAIFTNLPHGDYCFKYRAKTKNHAYPDFQELHFRIEAPYWVQWWFILLLLAALVIVVWATILLFIKGLRVRNIALEEQVQKRTSEIQEQNWRIENYLKELKLKHDELKKILSIKDRIFTIIAHDLKNPFNTLLGFSELLSDSLEESNIEESKKYSEIITKTSASTYNLLENLLAWSKSQRGKIYYDPESFAIQKAIQSNIHLLAPSAKVKGINIRFHNAESETYVFADYNMVLTIIRNLLSNAIKFTPPGKNINIDLLEIGDEIEIKIEDEGVGITKEDMEKLFRDDVHISTRGTNEEKGTGVGLILCRDFVERNQGQIRVTSEIGKGSSFVFTLPKAKDKAG